MALILLGISLSVGRGAAAGLDYRLTDHPIQHGFTWRSLLPEPSVEPLAGPRAISGAEYTFSKTVLLQAVFDANDGDCAPSVKALTVSYGEAVVYCYLFTNIGATSFITVSLADDKLGAFGPIPFDRPLQPGGKSGFVAYSVIITQTTPNTATSSLIDALGAEVTHSDSAIVSLGAPVTSTLTPAMTATETPSPTATTTSSPTLTPLFGRRLWLPMIICGVPLTSFR